MMEELASHGFIVVGINHLHINAVKSTYKKKARNQQEKAKLLESNAQDVNFIIKKINELIASKDVFWQHADFSKICLLGHSFGGRTATKIIRQNPLLKCGINIDGGAQKEDILKPFPKPFMFMIAEKSFLYNKNFSAYTTETKPFLNTIHKLAANKKSNTKVITIKDAGHTVFMDTPLQLNTTLIMRLISRIKKNLLNAPAGKASNILINKVMPEIISFLNKEMNIEPDTYSYKLDKNIQKRIRSKPPYAALFKNSKNQLLYIATKHTNNISSATFDLIRKAFNKFSPDLIILEGIETNMGYSPQKIINLIENKCLKKWSCSESLYAADLANKSKIKFIGGEPNDKLIFDILKKDNYSYKDIFFFYFARQTAQIYREYNSALNEKKLKEEFIKIKEKLFKNSNLIVNKYNFNEYKTWLKLHLQMNPSQLSDSLLTAPINNGNFLQIISSKISKIRNKHILEVISEHLNKYKKILVIYGASHLSVQLGVLSKILNKPTFLTTTEKFKF